MIDYAQKPEYLDFINRMLVVKYPADPLRTVWITKLDAAGKIAAVVAFTNFTQFNCEVSIATDKAAKWATRGFLAICYRYAFKQMKLRRMTAVIDATNLASLKLCRKLGHTEEGTLKGWFGEKDGIAMRMLSEECRWIQEISNG